MNIERVRAGNKIKGFDSKRFQARKIPNEKIRKAEAVHRLKCVSPTCREPFDPMEGRRTRVRRIDELRAGTKAVMTHWMVGSEEKGLQSCLLVGVPSPRLERSANVLVSARNKN